MAEHGNWPIFSTEFGKFYILKDGVRQSSYPTDTGTA